MESPENDRLVVRGCPEVSVTLRLLKPKTKKTKQTTQYESSDNRKDNGHFASRKINPNKGK
jgi:hypothetical protein